MAFSDGVKRQLKISGWIVFAYLLALGIYLKDDIQNGFMAGDEEVAAGDAPYSELTWELLVLDPELRNKLWARYDKSPESEKEKAFLAVIHVIDALSPEQAEHLAKNLLEKSGNAAERTHRKKLLEMLERLGPAFSSSMKHIASYAAKNLSSPMESLQRKEDVDKMMNNIALETKDTGYKYCMQGGEQELRRCSERMLAEGHPNALDYLKKFLAQETTPEQRGAVLVTVAKNKIPFGKDFVRGLLSANNPYDIRTALRLIREYELDEYRKEIQGLRQSKYDSVVQDVDQTLSYLATRAPAQH